MSPVLFPIVWALAMLAFARTLAVRVRVLVGARPAGRRDQLARRIRRAALDGLGQRRFVTGEQPAGIMHALIFWGFVVLLLQVVTLFGQAFDATWHIPGLGARQPLGLAFSLARDVLEASVIGAVLYMLRRRLFVHTARLFGLGRAEERYREGAHWEGVAILGFILAIMLGGLLHDGARLVADDVHGSARDLAPLAALLADALGGLRRSDARTLSEIGWWVHNVTVLLFLNLLPLSKHFHILTAIPNLFFGKLAVHDVPGPLRAPRAPSAPSAALDAPANGLVGVATLRDLTWKQVLDTFSCTECGRCTAVCPATAAGSPLAPRQLILDLRDGLYAHGGAAANGPPVPDEVLWSCTTCMACVEACPVGIEHVATIVDMRRSLVDAGRMEPLLRQTLENVAAQGNSYGKSARLRARWTRSLDFDIPDARREPVRYLWFVGDFASFDEQAQRSSMRIARILHAAGVSFGLLYDGERNAGNDVRRVGEEGLFEMLAEQNLGVLADARFEAIFTTDPHSLNTLRNEYPSLGLDKPVYHYTELLADLLAQGGLRPVARLAGTRVTYHDPCYLARYNRITQAPRTLIEATGAEIVEMPRHGGDTFCCGAGGGRIWMDDSGLAERPSHQRIREAQALGAIDYFITTCPKDLVMYSDAARALAADFEVAELTALLERALGPAER